MAVATAPAQAHEGDLTDEQVEQMLARATQRLKEKDSTELAKKDDSPRYTFPKLQTGTLEKPYVSSSGDVATLDSKRQRELKKSSSSRGIRKVEDPVASKKAAEEVRSVQARFEALHGYEEIFPNLFA